MPRILKRQYPPEKRRCYISAGDTRSFKIVGKLLLACGVLIRHHSNSTAVTAGIGKDNGHCHKVHRAHGKERIVLGHDRLSFYHDRPPGIIQRPVFMQYTLGVACCAGGISDIAESMEPDRFIALQRLTA